MSEQDRRRTQAIGILESNEKRDPSQQNQELILRSLATLQEVDPVLYEEWIDRIANLFSAGTGQVVTQASLRAVVDGRVAQQKAVRAGTERGVEITQAAPEGTLLDPSRFAPVPAAPDEDEDLPRPLGTVADNALGRLEPGTGGGIERRLGQVQEDLYRFGDHVEPFASLGNLRIQSLQRRMERAGLLDKGDYRPGFWDTPTRDAMKLAMGFGNEQRKSYQAILEQLALFPVPKSELGDPAALSPDPASIAQDVKATFRQRLGREPSASELRELGSALGGFETESLAQQAELAATGRLLPEFTSATLPGGSQISGGKVAVPDTPVIVDPRARFLELFDKRFGPEEARNRRVIDVANQRRSVMSSLTTMQALIEGG